MRIANLKFVLKCEWEIRKAILKHVTFCGSDVSEEPTPLVGLVEVLP